MRFTVVWKPTALNDLAAIWLAAASEDCRRISSDARAAETTLRDAAETAGESRSGDDRMFFVGVLSITVEVREADRMATILAVRHSKREL